MQITEIYWRDLFELPVSGNRWIKPSPGMLNDEGYVVIRECTLGSNKLGTAEKKVFSVCYDGDYIVEYFREKFSEIETSEFIDLLKKKGVI